MYPDHCSSGLNGMAMEMGRKSNYLSDIKTGEMSLLVLFLSLWKRVTIPVV